MTRHLCVIGLSAYHPGASFEEIRSRYRALAMQHHPDHGGSVDRMREINGSYRAIVG